MSGNEGIIARRAPVVPRARVWPDGEVYALEEHVRRLRDRGMRGFVNVVGPAGSGKTTAMEHLAVVAEGISLLDESDPLDGAHGLFSAATRERAPKAKVVLQLAPWTEDDWIEYLLNQYPEQCRSVITRMEHAVATRETERLQGLPAMVVPVLKEFAADETLNSVKEAILRRMRRGFDNHEAWSKLLHRCLKEVIQSASDQPCEVASDFPILLPVAELLASEALVAEITKGQHWPLEWPMAVGLIRDTAAAFSGQHEEQAALERVIEKEHSAQAMGASILLASNPAWHPAPGAILNLKGARLSRARWRGAKLACANLSEAHLEEADLAGTDLKGTLASSGHFRSAHLAKACLIKMMANGADFSGANLQGVDALGICAEHANFTGADLTGAILRGAKFTGSNFRNTHLARADFRQSQLVGVEFQGADLMLTDFEGTTLRGIDFRETNLLATNFMCAQVVRCSFEGVIAKDIVFAEANLNGSYFTGSALRGATFVGASLKQAGLAEVDWEGVDLRNVDFANASFHMGSSRSGLVGSTIACEGSRTGFYTDEFQEQHFKAPEEIRKANLRGCDLRGAHVEKTDFYLVDLRNAVFSDAQRIHFQRCGAIVSPA